VERSGSPLLAGIIVGIVLAVLWALLVWVTHNRVGLAAWGIGGLIGVTLAKSSRKPDASLGLLAGGLTLGTVVLAKALIVVLALPQMSRDEILRNRQATATLFMVDMTTHRSFSPELQAAIDSQHDQPDTLSRRGVELSYRMMEEAGARAESARPAERERVVRTNTDSLLAHRGFLGLLGGMFGLWDLTWLGLGMSTAWKLAIAGWI
jgi:hypothetical protein